MKAACNGWSCSPCAKPSIVVISRPSTSAASERHDFTRLPSISTVQAPHWPSPQPFFEPVRCRCSRRASSSVVRGSSLSRCSVPLTRNTMSSGAGAAPAPCAAAGDTAPAMNCPPARAPPVTTASSSSSRRVTSELVIIRSLRRTGADRSFATLLENILCNRERREGVGPAGIKRQLRDHLPGLCLRQAVIHRPVEVVRDLRDLPGSNQGGDSDEAPVAWREGRTQPQVAEQNVGGVLYDPWSHRAELLSDARGAICLGRLVERKKRRGIRR